MENKQLLKFLGGGYWCLNKEMRKAFGTLESLWITHLLEWQQYLIEQNQIKEDEYFYLSQENIFKETGISPGLQTSYIKSFKEKNILLVKENIGLPARNYYYIDSIKMIETIQSINEKAKNLIKLKYPDLKGTSNREIKEHIYNNPNYINPKFKEDKSSLGASQPKPFLIDNLQKTTSIKPLSEEFQLLQNKEILYKECEEIFDYWCQFGKPLHKPQKNLINPTKTLQEAFIIISKELKRLNKQEIMNAIYYYYEMLITPDKYNLHCEDPLHLVGINDFFKFNDFLKKKQLSAKENNPAKNIKSWYWECAQGEEYLIKKYGRKPSPNQKQIQSIEDKYPNITQQFKWAWRNAMEIDKRFVLTTPEKDENAFRKASIFLKDFIKKWYDQLPETLPAHDYNEVYLSKPHTLAHNFIPAILFATEGMDDSIKITTSWLHTPKMEERLVRYYRDQGCMSDPNDDRDEEYDMEAYNL